MDGYRACLCWVLALVVLAGCNSSSSPTAPTGGDFPALSVTTESQNYVFHTSPDDAVDVEGQEAFHEWAVAQLGVATPRLHYYKYRSTAHMAALTGRSANGYAEPENLAVHSVFPMHAHEAAHVISALIGRPSDFFNEGLAVAMAVDPLRGDFTPNFNGAISVHDWARGQGPALPALADIVTTPGFRAVSDDVGYQTAGSFVAYLMEVHGTDGVVALFTAGTRDDSRSRIEADFQAAFGLTLAEAERRWHEYLGIGAG